MDVTFYGAAREVTGSMHMIATDADRILLDCGMFQGRRKEAEEKNRTIPFDPAQITNIILSHAHIDHSGRIPLLVKNGFTGRVISTDATADASKFLLLDSAHIQESDADYLNYKTARNFLNRMKTSEDDSRAMPREIKEMKKKLKRNGHRIDREVTNELIQKYSLEEILPLYSVEDANQAIGHFEGYPYKHSVTVGNNMTCRFYDGGHILGSAISIVHVKENGKNFTICYTGDFGRFSKPILKDPTLQFEAEDRDVDLMIMESTYGDRLHGPVKDLKGQLKKVIRETVDREGSVLIPSFAFGRTQELVYVLHELDMEGEIPKIPIYVDSPLATKLTRVFGEHPEVYDQDTHETFLENGKNPFSFGKLKFVESVEDSMALMREEKPAIIIASSGMCEGGRILHHLRYRIHNARNTILIVGFMARHTLGRRLLDAGEAYERGGRKGPAPLLRFLNKEYPLHARVSKISGFSAHGDKDELIRLISESNLNIGRVAVVHGEEDQALSFAALLREKGLDVTVPERGEKLELT